MHDVAPADAQDQPRSTPPDLNAVLAAAGVPRSIPTELLDFARRADLQLRAEEPGAGPAVTEPPEGEPADPAGSGSEEESNEEVASLEDFDPTQIPDDLTPEQARERISAFHRDYTTKTQEIAEQRRAAEQSQAIIEGLTDPRTAPEFLRILGIERDAVLDAFDLEIEGAGPGDEEELLGESERMDRIEARLEQEAQARAAAERENAEADHIENAIGQLEQTENREFDEEEVSLITTYSRVHSLPSGAPDVQGAFQALKGILQRRQQEWIESKKTTSRTPPNGQVAVKAADLATPEGRLKAAEAASARTRG